MASRQKAARSRITPYDRTKTSPQPIAMPISPPSTSPPEPASPITKPPETLRDCYLQTCKRFYPNIKPRNDLDIVVLASGKFENLSNEEFYAYSDCVLGLNYKRFTAEQVKDGSARAQIILGATKTLNEAKIPTGTKPCPGEDNVYTCPLPRSDYSLRLWGRGLEANREYCLDFINTATGQPVNSPFEYELWAVPNRKTPWLPMGTTRLHSLERSFGIAQDDILPGEEKFVLLEGTACLLKRPGMRPVYFEVPVRPRNVELEDVDELTFCLDSV